jgi:hypothetical protein
VHCFYFSLEKKKKKKKNFKSEPLCGCLCGLPGSHHPNFLSQITSGAAQRAGTPDRTLTRTISNGASAALIGARILAPLPLPSSPHFLFHKPPSL